MDHVHIQSKSAVVCGLPVEAVDHVPDGADQVLVLLWAGQDDAVKLLHVGVDGVECGRLSAACRNTGKVSQEKIIFHIMGRSDSKLKQPSLK